MISLKSVGAGSLIEFTPMLISSHDAEKKKRSIYKEKQNS